MRFACSFVLIASVSGCGPRDEFALVPVEGRVVYRGEPVAGATVVSYPANGPVAIGTTGSDGRFRLVTNGRSGAVAGGHVATITLPPSDEARAAVMAGRAYDSSQELRLPARYADRAASGLEFTVSGRGKDVTLEIRDDFSPNR